MKSELMTVRDYELDSQQRVNNSVYLNYFEHVRHECLLQRGIDFIELIQQGIHLVAVKCLIDYKQSLISNNRFYIDTQINRKGKSQIVFNQTLYLHPSDKVMNHCQTICVAIDDNQRILRPTELFQKLCDIED